MPKKRSLTTAQQSFLGSHEELDLFHYMLNQIGDEVMVIAANGQIVFANDATVQGLGFSRQTILKRNITDFFKEKISVQTWKRSHFTDLKRRKKPISYVIERVVKGGKTRVIDVTASYMQYKSAEYILSIGRDITEQANLQDKLKESEDLYRILSEQAADGIFVVDFKGIITYANQAAEQIVKIKHLGYKGKHFERFVAVDSIQKAREFFRQVKKGVPVIRDELHIVDKKGKIIPVEFTASPIVKNKKVVQIHTIFRDITRRKELEALVRESDKRQALQHFIAGTSREIQYPLKGIYDRLENLIGNYKNRAFEYIGFKEYSEIFETLETMRDQVKYCFDTTNRLINLNKRKVGLRHNHCAVNTVIRDAIKSISHQSKVSGITLKTKLSAKLPDVAIGAVELNQALVNVLTNAMQSVLSDKGVIQIKTTYQKTRGFVRIDCQDNGIGIPKDVLSQVFEPFFTTKERGLEKSSGLGLSIVYSLIKAYRGEVVISSHLKKGTLVKILLPVYKKRQSKNDISKGI